MRTLLLLSFLTLPAFAETSPMELEKLLSDPSYDVRRSALEKHESAITKDPGQYKDQLRLALRLEPSSVRLEAVEIIGELPKEIRIALKDTLKVCVKEEKHPEVKSGCQKLLKN